MSGFVRVQANLGIFTGDYTFNSRYINGVRLSPDPNVWWGTGEWAFNLLPGKGGVCIHTDLWIGAYYTDTTLFGNGADLLLRNWQTSAWDVVGTFPKGTDLERGYQTYSETDIDTYVRISDARVEMQISADPLDDTDVGWVGANFQFDGEKPSTPSPDDGVSGWSNDPTPTFSWTAASDPSGITGYSWLVDSQPDDIIDTTSTSVTLPIQSDGLHTFYVKAIDNCGNAGDSGSHGFQIYQTIPSAPLVECGPATTKDNTPTCSWNEPVDLSGISGYSWSVDSTPGDTVNILTTSITLPSQSDGFHVFRVKAKNNAGSWGGTGSDSFTVDTIPPQPSPSPDDGVAGWSSDNTPTFSWPAVPDAVGYSYEIDNPPDDIMDITTTSVTPTSQPDGTHIFHVKAVDSAGNWGTEGQHEFKIDTQAPDSAVQALSATQPSTTLRVSWSGSDGTDASGIRSYDVQYRVGTTGSWTDRLVATTQTFTDFTGANGLTYYFQSRALDDAGNQEAYPGGDGDTWTTIQVSPDVGYIQGFVYDDATSLPIAGATVQAGTESRSTDSSGAYNLTLIPGTYTVTASKTGYATSTESVTVTKGQTVTQDFGLRTQPGWVVGTVRDNETDAPIQGATVAAGGQSTTTSAAGAFNLTVAGGTYDLTCSKFGYLPRTIPITIVPGAELNADCRLDPAPPATIRGRVVVAGTAEPVEGASVTASGAVSTTTDAQGNYELQVPAGTYDVTVTKDGFRTSTRTVTLAAQETRVVDFELERGASSIPPEGIPSWAVLAIAALIVGSLIVGYVISRRRRESVEPKSTPPRPTTEAESSALMPTPVCPYCGNDIEIGAASCPVCGGTMTWSRDKQPPKAN